MEGRFRFHTCLFCGAANVCTACLLSSPASTFPALRVRAPPSHQSLELLLAGFSSPPSSLRRGGGRELTFSDQGAHRLLRSRHLADKGLRPRRPPPPRPRPCTGSSPAAMHGPMTAPDFFLSSQLPDSSVSTLARPRLPIVLSFMAASIPHASDHGSVSAASGHLCLLWKLSTAGWTNFRPRPRQPWVASSPSSSFARAGPPSVPASACRGLLFPQGQLHSFVWSLPTAPSRRPQLLLDSPGHHQLPPPNNRSLRSPFSSSGNGYSNSRGEGKWGEEACSRTCHCLRVQRQVPSSLLADTRRSTRGEQATPSPSSLLSEVPGFIHPVPADPADVPGLVHCLSGLGLLPGFSTDKPGRSQPRLLPATFQLPSQLAMEAPDSEHQFPPFSLLTFWQRVQQQS